MIVQSPSLGWRTTERGHSRKLSSLCLPSTACCHWVTEEFSHSNLSGVKFGPITVIRNFRGTSSLCGQTASLRRHVVTHFMAFEESAGILPSSRLKRLTGPSPLTGRRGHATSGHVCSGLRCGGSSKMNSLDWSTSRSVIFASCQVTFCKSLSGRSGETLFVTDQSLFTVIRSMAAVMFLSEACCQGGSHVIGQPEPVYCH